MVRVFVRHGVTDYAKWRAVYDGFDATRKSLGATDQGVFRGVEDDSQITVFHDFPSAEVAQAFMDSPELKAAMMDGGVDGAPTIWFTHPA